jgi:2-keto-4-pentenoate hydratase/2-oxohepta-3-ene-1,7-dioic acid hydratase in catechol pathway
MKLLTFIREGKERLGVATDRGILDVEEAGRALGVTVPAGIMDVLSAQEEALSVIGKLAKEANAPEWYLPEQSVTFAPSVTRPGKIVCVGLNYRAHALETGKSIPDTPVLFNKFSNALNAHGGTVHMPEVTSQVDYEAEVVIVIGRKTANVGEDEALRAVFGYTAGNDVSARDLQYRTSQWMLGKTSDGFAPIGPYVVTADEVGDPNRLTIECFVNGERRQHSNTSDMIFSCAYLVSYLSRHMTLMPGDIIFTGTPEGVMLGYPPEKRVYLQDGDVVDVVIEKLGTLRNRFAR